MALWMADKMSGTELIPSAHLMFFNLVSELLEGDLEALSLISLKARRTCYFLKTNQLKIEQKHEKCFKKFSEHTHTRTQSLPEVFEPETNQLRTVRQNF